MKARRRRGNIITEPPRDGKGAGSIFFNFINVANNTRDMQHSCCRLNNSVQSNAAKPLKNGLYLYVDRILGKWILFASSKILSVR